MCERDRTWMDLALAEAERGRGAVEPNPMVGAVIVRDGEMVGKGHHARYGEAHAEVMALQEAGAQARGATLYVTLEPCCHHGKTPPCTDAIRNAGLARVVVAIRDPFPAVDGGGLSILRQAGIQVDLGVQGEQASRLNGPFLKCVLTSCSYVIAKWAMTLDGKTAVATGDSQWISSAPSREIVHHRRGQVDAILVGIGTVLHDDPMLTARPPGPRVARRVVLDSAGQLPLQSRLARTARDVTVIVAVTDRAPESRVRALTEIGCEVIHFSGSSRVPLGDLLHELDRVAVTNVLVEGGGKVLGSFLDQGLIDEVDVFIAPILEGGDHPRTPARGAGLMHMSEALRLQHVAISDVHGDCRFQGILEQPWRALLPPLSR